MAERTENQEESSICLEAISFEEMMQMMMGQKGVGSLSAEMMMKVTEKQGDDRGFSCAEMMREMIVLDDYQVWFFAQVSAGHRAQRPSESEHDALPILKIGDVHLRVQGE
jgi:hypothetical protein